MPSLFRLAAPVALLVGAAAAHAQTSMLRLACDEDSAKAEVTLNGKFVGECPVDVPVPAGTVRVQATKRVDARQERYFEEEFRIGPGVAKKVQIQLGPVGPNAEGRRLAAIEEDTAWKAVSADRNRGSLRAYLARYPQGRFAAEARQALASLPPRPQFPSTVPEEVLDRLEASEAFRSFQKGRASKFTSQATLRLQDGTVHAENAAQEQSIPGDGYLRRVHKGSMSGAGVALVTETDTVLAVGGLIPITQRISQTGGQPLSVYIKRLEEVSGSLLPPRAGAELRYRYASASTLSPEEYATSARCTMAAPVPAASVDARLTGQAWPVRCVGAAGSFEWKDNMYYLEDYSSLSTAIGISDLVRPNLQRTVNKVEFSFEP